MMKARMLEVLPPYEGNDLLIKSEQSTRDIIREVLDAHQFFAGDYDRIINFFSNNPKYLYRDLFRFLQNNVRYEIESEKNQTTMSPAAILALSRGDCKHYSSFIGGILDAKNRAGDGAYDWSYRFAGYRNEPIGHVYIVVYGAKGADDIWIDPAPLPGDFNRFTARTFNDRMIEPTTFKDLKPQQMSLNRISGIGQPAGFVSTAIVKRAELFVTDKNGDPCGSCIGRYDLASENGMDSPYTVKTSYLMESAPQEYGYEDYSSVQTMQPTLDPLPPLPEVIPAPMASQFGNIDGILNTFVAASQGFITKGEAAQYLVNGVPLIFPAPTYGSQPPPQNLQIVYPESYRGKVLPAGMPRPIVVGNRILILPKRDWQLLKDDNYFWLGFLTSVMAPLIASYCRTPTGNSGMLKVPRHGNAGSNDSNLSHYILYDTDKADVLDYVSIMTTKIPILSDIPEGVTYMMNDGQPLPFSSARSDMKGTVDIQWFRDNNPPAMPNFVVNYPSSYLGKQLPANFPKPVWVNGQLQCLPKGLDWNILKNDNFFWLTFLCSTFAPIIDTYSQFPYSDDENKLAERLLYDQDSSDPIGNYLNPPITKTWIGEIIQDIGEIIVDIGSVIMKYVGIIPRTAFLLLCRFNVKGMAKALKSNLDDVVEGAKLIDTWKKIGGTQGDLVDAVEDGATKKSLGTIGMTGAEIAAALAAAAPIIALLAGWLKKASPELAPLVDEALDRVNKILVEAGEDPIKLGELLNKPVHITDPVTGEVYTVNPPPKTTKPGFLTTIGDFIKANPVQSAIIGIAAIYVGSELYKSVGSRRKRTAS